MTTSRGSSRRSSATQRPRDGAGCRALTAVDEGSVEPSPSALPRFLRSSRRRSPIRSRSIAAGASPTATGSRTSHGSCSISPSGRILWYWDVSTAGWLSRERAGQAGPRRAARAPHRSVSAEAAQQELAGSPAPLAALHAQAGQLLGSEAALAARIRALRGYPIVVNAWASWCAPCRSEFGLFASASARYGRQVAFLGADTDDTAGDAQAFLAQHPVSYPSYQISTPPAQLARPPGSRRPADDDLHQPRRQGRLRPHGPVRRAGNARSDITTYALG